MADNSKLAQDTIDFLRLLEWSKLVDGQYICPSCEERDEHTENCTLARLIALHEESLSRDNGTE